MTWVVAMTLTGNEVEAIADLTRAGFVAYCPRYVNPNEVLRGKIGERPRALFPGYTFFRLTERWQNALGSRHVLDVLRDGETPATVPQGVIDEIRRREAPDGVIREPKRRRRFRAGKLVRTNKGSLLADLVGIVRAIKGGDRVVALLDVLGCQTPVTIRETDLTEIN